MTTRHRILEDTYHDSVQLMRIASDVAQSTAVENTEAVMGTATNKDTLRTFDGIGETDLSNVTGDDIVLVATGSESDVAADAVDEMASQLESAGQSDRDAQTSQITPKSIRSACASEQMGVAVISVPGAYAAREAWNALHEGLHTQVFSDNVSIERERELKTFAHDEELLMMGPDCGTAILDGVPLGFANEVASGPIGLVSASGTGLQAVSTHVSRHGTGISQAIGTGGRDLSETIEGLTTRTAIRHLDNDEATEVIVLLSKPPAETAVNAVLETVAGCQTPVIAHFQGVEMDLNNMRTADTLVATADLALGVTGSGEASIEHGSDVDEELFESDVRALDDEQTQIRGLFTGGTLCTEAALIADETVDTVYSNVGIGEAVSDPLAPTNHAFIDFGTDELTTGQPHPMIDPTLRNEQLRQTLTHSSTGIVLIDVVLGHGSHPDPAVGIADTVAAVDTDAPVVASVCGTDGDPQQRPDQIQTLRDAGVYVAGSNAEAARLAARGTTWMTPTRPEGGSS